VICSYEIEEIEVSALVLITIIVFHDPFIQFELLLSLLVVVDEERSPVVFVGIFEEPFLLLLSLLPLQLSLLVLLQ